MIGLAYLVFLVVYLAISIGVVIGARKLAGDNIKQKRIAGIVAGIVMYMLVFWDWIPVLVEHKHLCETQAGFWVYKTPEEWIKENPDTVGEDWGSAKLIKTHPPKKLSENNLRYWISEDVYIDIKRVSDYKHQISLEEKHLIDASKNTILAKSTNFWRGSTGAIAMGAKSLSDYKIWLAVGKRGCSEDNQLESTDLFDKNRYKLELLGKGEKQ